MKIGILGGTFNPIHFGHLVLAEQVYEKLNLNKLIFIPSYFPPHKHCANIISAEHRYRMVKLAIKGNRNFTISDIEIKRKGKSFLVDTLRHLKNKYCNSKLFFISGLDASNQISKWKDISEIFKLAKFVLASRPGFKLKKYRKEILFIPITELDISSSFIRRRIRLGRSVRYLLPQNVYEYINKQRLYR